MGFHSVDLIECTPGSADTWTDTDLDTYIASLPADVCGVQLLFYNTRTAVYDYNIAARCNGSTDDRYGELYRGKQTSVSIGVDANKIFQVKIENTTYVKVFITGYYTGSDIVFFTNAISKATATTGSYVDVDCSADVSATAVGVFGQIFHGEATYPRMVSVRKNGSTDDRYTDVEHQQCCYGFIIGIDDNKIFEQKIEDTDTDIYISGYIEDTAAVFNTNATDCSLASADSYISLAALPDGGMAGIYEIDIPNADYSAYIRKVGHSGEAYYRIKQKNFCVVEGAGEGKIEYTSADFWLVGYFYENSVIIPRTYVIFI